MTFLNTGPEAMPGVIVMSLKDGDGSDDVAPLDPLFQRLVTVFNARWAKCLLNVARMFPKCDSRLIIIMMDRIVRDMW
jgi:hypothetical protein